MSKELPYFKFEPAEWDTGRIQLMPFEIQGVFINICSFYWQRLGDLDYELVLNKICRGDATALRSLCDKKIIAIQDEKIIIEFLDEQLNEFEKISQKNKENALIGWKKRKKNAKPMRPLSDPNAIREEKRKEKKVLSAFQNNCLEAKEKLKVSDEVFKEFIDHWIGIDADTGLFMWQSTQNGFNIESRLRNWNKKSGNKSVVKETFKPMFPGDDGKRNYR